MILRNVSPQGDLFVSNGYGYIDAGASFAVKPEHVAGLIGQVENFEPADDEATAARAAYDAASQPEPDEPAEPAADVSLIKNEAT